MGIEVILLVSITRAFSNMPTDYSSMTILKAPVRNKFSDIQW
jgi:hypothetical protein